MYLATFLLLPLLVSADFQDTAFKYLDKAKTLLPQAAMPNPIDAGAAVVSAKEVQKINIHNWQSKLSPKPEGPQEWLIYMTGANKTCFGNCDNIDSVWNKSVPLLLASKKHPMLGYVNCDQQEQLCTAWAAAVPSFWYFNVAQKQTPQGPSPLHIAHLNFTTVTPQQIASLYTEKKILEREEYTGYMHPIDGILAQYGMLIPLGYALFLFGTIPSWAVMIGISFLSRQYMNKKIIKERPPIPGYDASARPAAAAPAGGKVKPKKA